MIRLVPIGVLALLLVPLLVAVRNRHLDRTLSRVSFRLSGGREIEYDPSRERLLRSAGMAVPYREYAGRTHLYAVVAGFSGAIAGLYVGAVSFALADAYGLWTDPVSFFAAEPALDSVHFGLLLVASLGVGVAIGGATYAVRWRIPAIRADARRRRINATLPRTVAFMYALTRGGMSMPDVFRTLAENEAVFGESAAEFGTAVRNMDLFNVDLITAVENLSDRTPSDGFSAFTENLASVLQSGGSVSTFLDEQYERYREETEEQQSEILNLLATTAEVYVTVVVAGMLFLNTILLIIGLTVGDTLFTMRAIAYAVLPATNLLFLAHLLEITHPLRASGGRSSLRSSEPSATVGGTDRRVGETGGYTRPNSESNHARLLVSRRLRSIRTLLTSPVAAIVERPVRLFYLTVPIAVLVTAYRVPTALSGGGLEIEILDDLLVQAIVFLTGTFALVHEYRKRRLRGFEVAVPDLLERLASLNEAGVAMAASFGRVRKGDVGPLDSEVDRIWRDLNWGATFEQALVRFEKRVRTPSSTRIVTLITNAMRASNEIGPVLRIAADQARSDLDLRRRRKREMFTYLVVIYVSFFVFLVVIVALEGVLIPNLPDTGAVNDASAVAIPGFGGAALDREAYRLVFFHTALVQSVVSGFVGGVMGSGSVEDGMKHATAMLSITYLVLVVVT